MNTLIFLRPKKYVKVSYSGGSRYDICYEYNSGSLGVEYVRFYIKDDLVDNYYFGDITDESVAQKDKYLRQILD
ncbi:hypothetical protein [Streptococcus chenjunshii]|uniref:hypothetical protein n=1 Tax=Streptococcus chenjunshii TaxID=2173853 RepID=UPI001F53F598|nr:hypothetical protein [Streptococcus chenjunshii]